MIIPLLLFLLIPLRAVASEEIHASALVEMEWAFGTARASRQKLEGLFQPELNIPLPFGLDLTAIGQVRSDVYDQLEPGSPAQTEVSPPSRRLLLGDRVEMELREFYVKALLGRTFLTIGKQQIVWGKADGLKVLDVVNPQDFREFILDDFDDSRVPLWAANVEIPLDPFVAQLVWVPDQTYHALPEPDSLYAFTTPLFRPTPPPGVAVRLRRVQRPLRVIADSDVGIRLSTFWHGWDLTLNHLYHYHDIPVFFRSVSLSPDGPQVTITPQYRRTHLLGGTFSNAFGNLTVRGELGFSFDRFFLAKNLADADGIVKTNELASVLGLDWYGFEEAVISGQFFQTWLTANQSRLRQDTLDNNLSLLVRREFLNDSLVADVIWIQNFNRSDGLVRPKVSYELRDNIKVWVGTDIFYGSRTGLFGQFDRTDRVVVGIEWGT